MSHQLPNLVTSQKARAVQEGRARSARSLASWKGVGLSRILARPGQTPGTPSGSKSQGPEPPCLQLQEPLNHRAQDPQVTPDGQATAEGEDLPDKESASPGRSLATAGPGGKCQTSK